MKRTIYTSVSALALFAASAANAQTPRAAVFAEPSLSPDGTELAFGLLVVVRRRHVR